ncbi:hypothetical protein GGS23DRAFT_371026 [Durotheca rogersii]|uniref:uncharacterized protein n=1 Tax=Durotheca rogersii TaxID=419775 RepID=UPI002220FFF8|nr:uncharacterized protein GGS23DRAFT_371026 [Durotheca rogersii]KAI5866138.1 hypothetical protein GGS23DRAFT_371026 [Durotheca rogersii]
MTWLTVMTVPRSSCVHRTTHARRIDVGEKRDEYLGCVRNPLVYRSWWCHMALGGHVTRPSNRDYIFIYATIPFYGMGFREAGRRRRRKWRRRRWRRRWRRERQGNRNAGRLTMVRASSRQDRSQRVSHSIPGYVKAIYAEPEKQAHDTSFSDVIYPS